jgi:hypothetical protein
MYQAMAREVKGGWSMHIETGFVSIGVRLA